MIEVAIAIMTGLLAGIVHVVSGPDHMAAVLPFAVDAPRRAVRLGIVWGVGHGLGVVVLGVAVLTLRTVVDIEWISSGSELLVGLLLIALGGWALRRSRVVVVHHHRHEHPRSRPDAPAAEGQVTDPIRGGSHAHPHVHFNDPTVDAPNHASEGRHRFHHHSTLGFGFIHGLAGAGHLVVASPMLALGWVAAPLYLLSYLIGGMGAMTGFAFCAGALVRKPAWIPTALTAAGWGAVAVGVFWVTTFAAPML